jgi:DNA (cytosine-5)-methyltransferase 1
MSPKINQIKVIELFAGVGGFRVGLEQASNRFKIVWSNQWEPSTKSQDASHIYVQKFGSENHSNEDIAKVATNEIPDHDMLVGGFPCQDYSVARTLNMSAGLEGKKGVLWWQIHRILSEKKNKPKYLFLENVDRLLKSPATQRGRDFAIMLASLSDLGYIVEWRVINAADYGMPQRRRRVFFLGYHKTSSIYKEVIKSNKPENWIIENGILAEAFPVMTNTGEKIKALRLEGDVVDLSNGFNKGASKSSPFENSGIMIDRMAYTIDTEANYNGPRTILDDIIFRNGSVPKEYFIDPDSVEKWLYLKGGKNEKRINKATGIEYSYSEGAMVFPDPLDRPSRTIITGEGGNAPSRFKHVIRHPANKRFRRLTPIELERLNMFPDNHTSGVSDIKRAFFMGNALVVGVIEKIGSILATRA